MNALFIDLTWWQLGLVAIYSIYTLIRAYVIFDIGLKEALLGYNAKSIKLYHILWAIIDIPAMFLGKLYHILKFFFAIDVFPLKRKQNKQQ